MSSQNGNGHQRPGHSFLDGGRLEQIINEILGADPELADYEVEYIGMIEIVRDTTEATEDRSHWHWISFKIIEMPILMSIDGGEGSGYSTHDTLEAALAEIPTERGGWILAECSGRGDPPVPRASIEVLDKDRWFAVMDQFNLLRGMGQ